METMGEIQQASYSYFTHENFKELSEVHDTDCISIYFPTHRAGKEVDDGEGQMRLKNALKGVRKKLQAENRTDTEIDKHLAPVVELLDDVHFWRNLSDGLAIFVNQDGIRHFSLPVAFDPEVHVDTQFYLLPLLPFFNGDGLFYILSITQQNANFFEANRNSITEISIQDDVPESVDKTGAYGDNQTHIQFRSGKVSDSGAMFHGQGAGKDNDEKNLEKYFREIDTVIMEILHDKQAPLVLVCQDQYYPIYKRLTNYNYLYPAFVAIDPQSMDTLKLHEEAWETVQEYFDQPKKKKLAQFNEHINTLRTSAEVQEIIPAAVDGRIDTLFILKGMEIFGMYDQTKRTVAVESEKSISNTSLLNLAAVHSFEKGAAVFLVSSDEMPISGNTINALFRY